MSAIPSGAAGKTSFPGPEMLIATLTLNPMLDKTLHVASLQRGKIRRADRIQMVVGGKGVNVSRQLTRLGRQTLATGFLGGEIGVLLARLLTEEKIPHDFVRIGSMTREGVTYREHNGSTTAVFEPPHKVTRQEVDRLVRKCRQLPLRGGWIVCSGSSPGRSTDTVYRDILEEARRRGVETVLDSYGPALLRGITGRPTLVKVNRQEYEKSFRVRLNNSSAKQTAVRRLLSLGPRYAIITDGSRDAYGAFREAVWRVTPPRVETVNSTGSGDSMLAGLLFGLTTGWSFPRALRFGAAAGAANAGRWEVASSSHRAISALAPEVLVEEI
jgi:1-phosphofructokinase family hexose kinase